MNVYEAGPESSDVAIWKHAVGEVMVVVTKDEDFEAMALVFAPLGKVILVPLGNGHTDLVDSLLRRESSTIRAFLLSAKETVQALP